MLYILNQKPLLRFLFHYVPNLQNFEHLTTSIVDAGVGTYDNIEVRSYSLQSPTKPLLFNPYQVARENTTIIEAVNKFVSEGISALPIVDATGRLINIYCKFDVINLVATKTYSDLEVTLKEATEHKMTYFDGVHQCKGGLEVPNFQRTDHCSHYR